jgi:RTX calcium-binding nonapeptide repeat (4 copies)/FG-GAP repeat
MAFSALNLSNLNGSNGFALHGIAMDDFSGFSVSGAGDVNNDGIDDLIIGAYGADPNGNASGQSYVVFGRSSGFASSLNLSNLNGSNGFILNGIAMDDFSGFSVSGAGDVNNDGIDDFIIGAPNSSGVDSGQSYVVFGRSGGFSSSLNLSNLNGSNGFILNGIDVGDNLGSSVSGAGDINNDGIDDLIIGAVGASPNDDYYSGQSYVVFGRSGGFSSSLNFSNLNGSNGFILNGIEEGDFSGWSVSGAGDVNNDGIDDVIIGAISAHSNGSFSGQSYVVFGQSGGFSASFNLSNLNGSNGFLLNGIAAYDSSGNSVSGAGDVNNDGIDDLIIGAVGADPNGNAAGQSYVVFGRSGGFSASFNLSNLNGSNGFSLNGIDVGDNLGSSVSGAGDVNNDGIDDLIIGAFRDAANSGQSYVVYGVAFAPGTLNNDVLTGTAENDTLEGLAGNDTLSGGLKDDVLDGGSGNDVLMGQQGSDIYIVDSIADSVVESTNQGNDTVRVSFGYTLRANVERLGLQGSSNLIGTGNSLNNFIVGNLSNNFLKGLAGNDTLMGNEGVDTLVGGTSNDVYYLESLGDTVIESANEGTDTVRSFTHYILEANVERLGLQGSSNLQGTGNNLANYIAGNFGSNLLNGQAGNDSLNGGVGNDTFYGGAGNDLLTGGIGDDRFLYSTGAAFVNGAIGIDRLTDFRRFSGGNTDKIVLSQTTFVAGTNFASVGTDALAATSAAHITFSTGTGHLFYNQNGANAGLGTGGHFATLSDINSASITGTNTLLATDFLVIA